MTSKNYVFDDLTERLLHLTSEQEENRNVEEIINLLNELAPKLLEGLSKSRRINVVKKIELKCYPFDTVVFNQNDQPDAFYTVIRGAVSLYAKNSSAGNDENTENPQNYRTKKYGKFLVQLPPESGFGELSFTPNGNHSKRSAGVVSDGNHGQTKIQTSKGEVQCSNVAILLLIDGTTYLSEMFARDTAIHQTKDKVDFLKSSFFFSLWSVDQLFEMSHSMKLHEYTRSNIISSENDKVELIWIIVKGKVVVKRSNDSGKIVTMAELSKFDVLGILEALKELKKMRRTFMAGTDLALYSIPINCFMSFLEQVPSARDILEAVVKKRVFWEDSRLDYSNKFPNQDVNMLPNFLHNISEYRLDKECLLSQADIKRRKEQSLKLYKLLRDARSNYRLFLKKKTKTSRPPEAERSLIYAEDTCNKVIKMAKKLEDKDRTQQALALMKMIKQEVDQSVQKQYGDDLNKGEKITNAKKTLIKTNDSRQPQTNGINDKYQLLAYLEAQAGL